MSPLGRRYDGVPAIARAEYGEDTPATRRRVRYLIEAHDLPVVQRGRLIWTFEAWLAAYRRGERVEIGGAG
jgi:hypothetical protein